MQIKQDREGPKNPESMPHSLTLHNRSELAVTGVTRVVSCDETVAVLETEQGTLSVGGRELTMGELSIQSGEVKLRGRVDYLQYTQKREPGGLLHRLTR